jgi:hypothetical protein
MAARRSRLRPLQLIIEGVDRATEPIRRINRQIESLQRPIRNVGRAFSSLAREAGLPRLAMGVRNVATEVGALGRRAAQLGAFLGLGGGSAFLGLRRFIDYGDDIGAISQKIGVSAEALQELRYAGEQLDVENADLEGSLGKLNKAIGEAARKPGPMRDMFRQLRIEIMQGGKIRPTEQILLDLADAMQRIENPAMRTYVATQLMSRGGEKMITMLLEGRGKINAFREDARALGVVLSEETVKAAGDADNELRRMFAVVRGVGFAIAGELLPDVRALVVDVTKWSLANRDLIRDRVVEFVRNVSTAVGQMIEVVRRVGPPILETIEALGGMKFVGMALATLIGGKLIFAVVSLGTSLVGLGKLAIPAIKGIGLAAQFVSVAMMANPWWLLITFGVAAAVAAGVWLYRNWDTVKEYFARFGTFMTELWKTISDSPLKYFIPAIGPILGIVDVIRAKWEPLSEFFTGLFERVSTVASAAGRFFGGGPSAGVAPMARPRVAPVPPAPASAASVSGQLGIMVQTAPGLVARTTSLKASTGLDLDVDLGALMAY